MSDTEEQPAEAPVKHGGLNPYPALAQILNRLDAIEQAQADLLAALTRSVTKPGLFDEKLLADCWERYDSARKAYVDFKRELTQRQREASND